MASSPVEFAAAFERMRTHIGVADADDSSLLQLLDFWPKLAPLTKSPAYSSYVAEYLAFLESSLTDDNLRDLSLADLTSLESLGNNVGASEPQLQLIRRQIARQFFFVGRLDEGLAACLRITREEVAIDTSDDSGSGLSEFETFYAFVPAFNEKWPATKKLLQELVEEWQAEREFVSTDRIYCLFVQNNGLGERSRGKLRALSGSVEERGRSAQNDEITFDNQLRASDDPIVGVAYQALSATRRYLRSTGYSRLGISYYHAHFAVTDKRAVYTGDSIGVATALLAYAQLLHTEALRHDHLLPGDVACTGGVDEAGTVTPVNGGSLHAKVERAFFSHLKYLALPSENVKAARNHLETLQPHYQARQLILLPIGSLSAAVNDHNIVRPEKVCIGRVVGNTMAKFSRMTTVQIPMLMLLAYLLLSVISPRTFWLWYDRNPNTLEIADRSITVRNTSGDRLWTREFPNEIDQNPECWRISDLDGDGKNEVLIIPGRPGYTATGGIMQVFNYRGDTLFTRDCTIRNSYPRDTISDDQELALVAGSVRVGPYKGKQVIITAVSAQIPARCYIRFWDSTGKPLGKYINSGFVGLVALSDFDGDGVEDALFSGTNNRMGCATVFLLDPSTALGVSPPYWSRDYDLTKAEKGNQKHIVFFPPSDLIRTEGTARYQLFSAPLSMPGGRLQCWSNEGTPDRPAHVTYLIDSDLHILEVDLTDNYRARLAELILSRKLPMLPIEELRDTVKNRVTYFVDGRLVTEGERRASLLHWN